MDYQIRKMDNVGIIKFWHTIDKYIAKALKHTQGEITDKQLLEEISNNTMQLWILIDKTYNIIGVVITSITELPNKKVFCIYAMSADTIRVATEEIMDKLFQFAKENKCNEVSILGRKGWEKILPKFGFKKEQKIILSKVL